ncbi:hypothetical protein QL285_092402 [Trifolium repens]|nr:hypothetical protein QL285_092402 [Trifolium repens]
MLASSFLGLQELTQVLITYEIYNNCFKVSVLRDESLASNDMPQSSYQSLETVGSGGEDDDPMLNDMPQNSYQSLETVNGGGEDDDPMLEDVDSRKAF